MAFIAFRRFDDDDMKYYDYKIRYPRYAVEPVLLNRDIDLSGYRDGRVFREKEDYRGNYFECPVKNGKLNGRFKTTVHFGDDIELTGHIKDGVLDGAWEARYTESGVTITGNYKNGLLLGPYKITQGKRTLLECNILKYEHGIKRQFTGPFKSYTLECSYDKDGELNGPYVERFEDGDLSKKCTYKHGKLDGKYENYSAYTHVLMRRCTYKNGKLDGLYEEFYDEDRPGIICHYVNGEKCGEYEEYEYDSWGNKALIKCNYNENGELDGRWQKLSNGKPWLDFSYRNGKLDGKCIEYMNAYGQYVPSCKTVFKNGEQIACTDYGYDKDEKTGKLVRTTYYDLPEGTKFSWDYWHSRQHRIQPELICKCKNLEEVKLDNSDEDRSGTWCLSNREIPHKIWTALGQNKNLKDLDLRFMDPDYNELSKLKKLQCLHIMNRGLYGGSGFTVCDSNIAALGTLPELTVLSIDSSYISANGLEMIKKQFPKLKQLKLKTSKDITDEQIVRDFGNIEFEINGVDNKAMAEKIAEARRQAGLTGKGFEDKFKEAVKKGNDMTAAEILYLNGLIEKQDKEWGDSYFAAPLENVYNTGANDYYGDDDYLVDLKIKDLKNGNYAIATRREHMHFSSGDGGETTYHNYGDLMIVNLKDGVLASKEIDYTKTPGWGLGVSIGGFDGERATYHALKDITVKDGKVSVCGTTLPVNPPKKKDGKVKAQLDKAAKAGGLMLEAKAPKKADKSAIAAVLNKKAGQDR